MAKYSYGLTSFIMGNIAAVNGALENGVEIITGIYKDTITCEEVEGTSTDHFVEGRQDPIVSIDEAGKTTIEFTFVDLSAAQKERFMGGTVTVVNGKNAWNKPDVKPNLERYVKYTLKDGTVAEYPRVKLNARLSGKVGQKEIDSIAVKLTVLTPNFPALKSVIVTDPA